MCRTCDEIQEKTIPLKGHLCPERTFRKVMGGKKSRWQCQGFKYPLACPPGTGQSFRGKCSHLLHKLKYFCLSKFLLGILLGFQLAGPQAQGQPDAALAPHPAVPQCGLRARWALGQGAPTILSMVLLLPGRSPCSRAGMEMTLKCFIVQDCFLKRCC